MDTLNILKDGETATVLKLTADNAMRRRLQDMGMINGTPVKCIMHSPLGDPAAYIVRGTVIALRSEDAGNIIVRRNGNGTYQSRSR